MNATIQHTLKTVFGFHEFRSPQQEVIEQVIAGEDVFLVMPTGGGKSLCYQIPALHRTGMAIVVSPLISLMKDQVDALLANGVRAACFNSSLSADEARRVSRQMADGELDLLYVAPERLMQPEFLERLSTLKLALFAIDEAHCISQWGHDFRPDYVQIGRLRGIFPAVPIVAMTATADPETRRDIIRQLGIEQATVYVAGFDRPNITYTVMPKQKPFAQLGAFLSGRRDEAGIVYALSRKRVEQVTERLRGAGLQRPPIMPVCPTRNAAGCRMPSGATTCVSWWPPWPSAWASTSPTCALWCTMTCPRAWRATTRRPAGPAGTACRPRP